MSIKAVKIAKSISGLKVEIFRKFNFLRWKDEVRFRIRAANGEIIASGESYSNRADAAHTINLLKQKMSGAEIVDLIASDYTGS